MLLVHAHPDDECLTTGGTIARYAQEGADVVLVTCTYGELGEVAEVPELGPPDAIRERLAEVRTDELTEACRRLGKVDLRLLGYHDSGMDGEPSNQEPVAFINQDLDEAAGKIADILREIRPQVVITYNEAGFYGHPDHIRAHQATLRAIDLVDHDVPKLYYTAVPTSRLRAIRESFPREEEQSVEESFPEAEIERIGTDDDLIAAAIDVTDFVKHKFAALEAHRTQYGTTERFLSIPDEVRSVAMGTEHYVLARTTVGMPDGIESDLFERTGA